MDAIVRLRGIGLTFVLGGILLPAAISAQQIGSFQEIPGGQRIKPPGVVRPVTDRIVGGMNRPVWATHAPGDATRLFIAEQRGVIRILDLGSEALLGTAFLDINALVTGPNSSNDERGLLGLAFHPEYATNGRFYVNYIDGGNDTAIAEYQVSGDPNIADSTSARILMTINQPQSNHNGGWIDFSPLDMYLYIATGDGGNFCDQGSGHSAGGNAQDITNNLLGKMLRIDPLGTDGPGGNYGIPMDNPFVGVTGDDEIWSYGLRNPYRNGFDSMNGDLYIADVGQDAREEVNYQPGMMGGQNYGWRCMEGILCSSASGCSTTGCTCNDNALTDPVHDYPHSPPPPPATFVCTVTGGPVYRGTAVPFLFGRYLFADFCGDATWSFRVQNGMQQQFMDLTSDLTPSTDGFDVNQIVAFGEDAAGEIYIVDRGGTTTGQIFKIVPGP